ncbi:MAG: hypothetical protein AB7D96_02200 [Arcobacteraceae bacterium]
MVRKILLTALLVLSPLANLWGYDPTAAANANSYTENHSDELSDRKVYDATVNEEVQTAGEDKVYLKTWEENRVGKVLDEKKWFKDVGMTVCNTPTDLVCPPLETIDLQQGYRSRINFVDLKFGQISCSVYPPVKDQFTPLTIKSETPLFTKVFTNQGCVEKYSIRSLQNQDNSESIKKLIEENTAYLEEIKEQEYKYTVDYKQNGDDQFLDLADILDGLVSFNANMFNFEETLLSGDLKTRNGFTTLPNETVVTQFEDTFKNFLAVFIPFGGDYENEEFLSKVENKAKIRDASAAVANSSYLMLLDFYLKSNDLMVLLAQGLAFLFVSYNVLLTWALPVITNKMQKKDSGENSPQRGIIGVIAIIMLFAGDVEKINVEYESKAQDIVTTELVVQQTNLQNAIQFLYSETNYWADAVAEIGIRAYLSRLSSSTGLFGGKEIQALANERIVLNKLFNAHARVDREMCFDNYEVNLIEQKLAAYRQMNLSKGESGEDYYSSNPLAYMGLMSSSGISSLRANPFPKSEREANAMMYFERNVMNFDNASPYNNAWAKDNSGVVKTTEMDKFRDAFYSPLSLSGCYNNRKSMIDSKQRLDEIESQFAKLADPSKKNAKMEYLKVINEIQWGLFAKQGYISMAYLPAQALLIENIGIVGDMDEQKSAIEEATGSEFQTSEMGTYMLQSIFEDVPYLTMFGGYQIAKMVHPVKDWVIDGVINTASLISGPVGTIILNFGDKFYNLKNSITIGDKNEGEIDLLDLKIAAFLIKNIFATMITVTLIVGSILVFTLLFVEKLFAFFAAMFLLIYAFSKNQEERMSTAIAKIFAVAFKTILIVMCIFLSLYSLNLVGSLEMIFVESFFKSMDMIENASWTNIGSMSNSLNDVIGWNGLGWTLITFFFKKYIFFGVTKFAFMALKMVLVIQMIWKMPGFMYELIFEKVHSVSDSVGETLQSVNERQTMRI